MKNRNAVFFPKILTTLKNYSLANFLSDLPAGVIVGIVELLLAIAFAIASGVTPDRGLVTAIIAGFIISLLGGSRVQIGGPTGAFVVIVYDIVQKHGVDGLIMASIMAGFILISMGVLRLGTVIKFIPYPLTVGFTSGIAVIIFSSQIKDFFGLNIAKLPADFIGKWSLYFQNFNSINFTTMLLSLAALAILILWPKINRRIPGSIIAIILITAIVQIFQIPVETIGSRFGSLPTTLPSPSIPVFTLEGIKNLLPSAITIALLGAIESLLSATVADGMIDSRHRSNTELIAQGVANIVTPLFGGIPATGAIARTATNVRNGGKTPVAGMIHAITLLLILLLFGQYAQMIPLCVLAAILIVVAYHMSEWHAFKSLLSAPLMDITVLVSTFLLTVFVDLTVAVESGLILSVFLFMKRMMDVSTVKEISNVTNRESDQDKQRPKLPQGVVAYEVEGAFFFGVAEAFRDTLDIGNKSPRVLILKMRHVLVLDATALRALTDLHQKCIKRGIQLIIGGIHTQPYVALDKAGFVTKLGSKFIVSTLEDAITLSQELLAS